MLKAIQRAMLRRQMRRNAEHLEHIRRARRDLEREERYVIVRHAQLAARALDLDVLARQAHYTGVRG